jgi:hypothetical protein
VFDDDLLDALRSVAHWGSPSVALAWLERVIIWAALARRRAAALCLSQSRQG